MTADITIDAGTLMFSAEEDMTATGILVPFGEECRSSIGRFSVDPGTFEIPEDISAMVVNTEHDRTNPVAVFASLREQAPEGIMATFRFANTPAGRKAFADAKSGERKRLSVEADGVLIRAGKAIAGRIFGGALVKAGAFDGATLLAAADTVTLPDGTEAPAEETSESSWSDTASDGSTHSSDNTTTTTREVQPDGTVKVTTTTTSVVIETPPSTDTTTTDATGGTDVTSPIPTTLQASARQEAAQHTPPAANGRSLAEVNILLAAAHNGDTLAARELREDGLAGAVLYAALTDIKGTGVGGVAPAFMPPQWVGEAYNSGTFERRYIPLFAHDDLTGFSIQGYRWDTPPVMAAWAGNKTNVPSAAVAASSYTKDAGGFAGAHDVDRRMRDFAVPEFWDGYWRHMSNSYRKLTDADALATIVAGATPVVAGAVPAGTNRALVSIVDGFIAVQDEGVPTFAILAPDLWREFILTPKDQTSEYLSVSLGLEEGQVSSFRIIPARAGDLAAGKTLVGIGQAATVYELPGSPLRVEGLDMVRGGIDPGAFGYEVTDVEDAKAFALVTPAA